MILRPRCTPSLPARLATTLTACFCAAAIGGCGSPGTPQPPSLKLPEPPSDLGVSRSGDSVTLHWTMPRRATDRVLLAGDQRAVICRAIGPAAAAAACAPAGQALFAPGGPATYTDPLPAPLRTGEPRLLRYTVVLQNHAGRSAGPSNSSFTAAGTAPPRVVGLAVSAESAGIMLRWQPAAMEQAGAGVPEEHLVRLHRSRVLGPAESPGTNSADARAGVPQPLEQPLELREPAATPGATPAAWSLDHATDKDALLNRRYRYTAERVARLALDGHPIELTGEGSEPASVDARDLFPPAVPAGLEAVGDPESGAIDLSWTPDTEPDLAGYIVYRRRAGASGQPVPVSGPQPVVDSAWRDLSAQPRVRYAYSVSAVDASGNQSARSPEAEEAVTPAPKEPPAGP